MKKKQISPCKIIALSIGSIALIYAIAVYFFIIRPSHSRQAEQQTDQQTGQQGEAQQVQQTQQSGICLAGSAKCWNTVDLAITPSERAQGLMGKTAISDDYGMLFVFETIGNHGFWMMNTLIPLDILWLNSDAQVVSSASMVPCVSEPCPLYQPTDNAKYALEIKKGHIEAYNITNGTQLQFSDAIRERIIE